MAFRVLYDANAVFGALQRSVLVRVGEKQPSFNLRVLLTDEILTEMIRAVSSRYSDFDDTQAINLKTAMIEAIPDCLVTGYQHRLNEVYISHPDDRHVSPPPCMRRPRSSSRTINTSILLPSPRPTSKLNPRTTSSRTCST